MSLAEEEIDAVLEADGTLRLSQKPQLAPGPVRVTLSPISQSPQRGLADVIREIAASQRARGYPGRTAEEIRAESQLLAQEDDDRNRELDAARRRLGPGAP